MLLNETDRMPPHDRAAEKYLLSVVLRENSLIPEIAVLVRRDDFYVDAHAKIFEAITSLIDRNLKADITTVFDWLRKKWLGEQTGGQTWADDIGGPVYLAHLWDDHGSGGFWRQYVQIVRDYAARRRLIHATHELNAQAFDLATPVEEVLANAEKRVMEIGELGVTGEAVSLQVAVTEAYQRLDARQGRGEGEVSGVPTGFPDLDALLCGFQNSELIVIAARPSVGKTAFALQIARHAAVDCGLPVFFVSLEQARVELAERLLCSQGRIDSHRLRRGHLTEQDQSDVMTAGETLAQAGLWIDDTPSQTMLRVAANARRFKQRHGIRLIVLDYLQLITTDLYRASRQEQVADSSRRLKHLARELKIPVIALAQVNRGPEDRTDKRPRLSDLRESGAIEADADTVLMLHRPDYYEPSQKEGLVEIVVAKQRNGPTDTVNLMYVKQFMRFENFAGT